jgi:hypothetical protein
MSLLDQPVRADPHAARPPAAEPRGARAPLPLFRFGREAPDAAAPLAVIGGGLILDSGEAERTFIYRCQDRFLVYTALWGLRSIFFVADEAHIALYRARIDWQRRQFDRMCARTGLFAGVPLVDPLYVGCNIDDMRVFACAGFAQELGRTAGDAAAGIALNQVSPTYADLVAQLEALMRRHGVDVDFATGDCARIGELALRCADKADYVALAGGARGLPSHVATAVVSAAELGAAADYAALAALYRARAPAAAGRPERLFVKATRNSSGNLAALMSAENFAVEARRLCDTLALDAATDAAALDHKAAELQQEIDDAPCLRPLGRTHEQLRRYKREQAACRRHVDFLLQPEVCRVESDPAYASIGLSYVIGPDGATAPVCTTAQVFRDSAHKHFQGAYLAADVARDVSPAFGAGMSALCGCYAARGYRGPINFDARRNADGAYELVYDCNPRLTGVFPTLAVRDALARSGVTAASVLTLGYRGEFVLPDPAAALERLAAAGLLCTVHQPRGVVLLPNLCRQDGFDVHLVDMAPADANVLLAPGAPLATLSASAAHPAQLFY